MTKKKKKKRNRKKKQLDILNESSLETLIRVAKCRGGRDTIVITPKKKYKRKRKHKEVADE
jgi:hypothetical protein